MSNNFIFCNQTSWFENTASNLNFFTLFNECVRHTVIVWFPTVFLWILAPFLVFQLWLLKRRRNPKPLPYTALLTLKHIITFILFLDSILLFVNNYFNSYKINSIYYKNDFSKVFVLLSFPLINAFSMSIMFVCIQISCKSGLISSGIIHLSWLLYGLCASASIFDWIFNEFNITSICTWAEIVWVVFVFIQSFLFCFSDIRCLEDQAKFEKTPEDSAPFLNRQLYWWLNILLKTGSKKDLEVEDFFELSYGSKAEVLVPLWERFWIPTIEKYNARKRNLLQEDSIKLLFTNKNSFSKEDIQLNKSYIKHLKPPSIVYNLFKMFKWELFASGMIKGFADILQFANPYLLKKLIEFIKKPDAPLWHGILYALLMFLSSQIRSISVNHYFYIMFRMGTKIQTALTAAIYKKTLRLSNASRNNRTLGEIVNLMGIDVDRFQMITSQIQQYWSSPFQITLALIFLFNTLGISAIPGVILMIIFVPYSVFGSMFAKKWQIKQMNLKDERTKMCSEVLNGIKVIKLYAWELPMLEVIERIRKKELLCILKAGLIRIAIDVFNFMSPFLVAIFSFVTFVLVNGDNNLLTPEIAFVSLTLFNQLRSPLTMIGFLINQTVQAIVSNKRMKEFFIEEEIDQDSIESYPDSKDLLDVISINDGNFSWGIALSKIEKEKDKKVSSRAFDPLVPVIQEINLKIKRGLLIAIVGRVGCGKSSLLSAILGEMEKLRGQVIVRGRVAYVPQTPWIQNMSLQENILFGKPYKKVLYDSVLEACALKSDIEILPYGDATEIGEKGINLSGGQKARISLARAVYQNCDIYLLDDPLSAVDSHVGKHIFDKVIGPNGLLANKTILLVTHGVNYLKRCDQILFLEDKQIQEIGTYSELIFNKKKFNNLVSENKFEEESNDSSSEEHKSLEKSLHEKTDKTSIDYNDLSPSILNDDPYCIDLKHNSTISCIDLSDICLSHSNKKTNSLQNLSFIGRKNIVSPIKNKPPINVGVLSNSDGYKNQFDEKKLIQKEHVDTGRVKFSIYLDYMKAAGYLFSFLFVFFFCAVQAFQVCRNIWLSNWADENDKIIANQTVNISPSMGTAFRLGIYGFFGVSEVFAFLFGVISLIFAGLSASHKLHAPVLKQIMHAPMSFFDTTPSGRILNRLGKDIETIDMVLVLSFRYCIMCIAQAISTLMVISFTTPLFIIVIIPLGILYIFILRYYVPTSRQLRRLESNFRSPIYSHFGESIQGVSIIRAFNKSIDFCHEIEDRTDRFIRVKYLSLVSNRWLAIRLEFIGNCIVLSAALFAALSKDWSLAASAGLVGLSVSYSLNVTEVLNFAIRQLGDLETNIVAVERLNEYINIETEAEWINENKKPPNDWPETGKVKFENYATRYRSGLDLVVKNINADILPAEKVGIVGRTGAGKSSLTLALFRMIEPADGRIIIDDIDISQIGLHDLRSNITIIPQDPILFSGSLRFNLDPFNKHSDMKVWKALELSHLKTFASSLPNGLEHEINEGGSNISLGQRQLLCLARALLRRSKILVLDEATAAVDLTTDALIQETIRQEFANSTVLTIAHRLNTIIDYDRVIVLDCGEIKEFDSPQTLLTNPASIFSSMAVDAKLF